MNWALCDGRSLPLNQSTITLYQVIGTYFGGDGRTTFALPDLSGRAAVGAGFGSGLSPYMVGQKTGTEQVPTQSFDVTTSGSPVTTVNSVDPAVANNVQPVLDLNYIICVNGIFPQRI